MISTVLSDPDASRKPVSVATMLAVDGGSA
jgi:hypothetical protein